MLESSDHRLGAIASRDLDRASEFAASVSISRYYGSDEAGEVVDYCADRGTPVRID